MYVMYMNRHLYRDYRMKYIRIVEELSSVTYFKIRFMGYVQTQRLSMYQQRVFGILRANWIRHQFMGGPTSLETRLVRPRI
jgi:hypothetical protein